MANRRAVETLATIRSSRFDLPLTYDAGSHDLQIGDVVRVPLGNREILAFVVSTVHEADDEQRLKPVLERLDTPRAFDETGLHLAKFIAEYYLCTLGEALGAVVLSGAVPRVVDSFVRAVATANPQRYPSVHARLVRLIWEELPDGFALETLLRHPEARRAGDRSALLRSVQTIVRSGELRRERRFVDPRTQEYRVAVLDPGGATIKGKKAQALVAFVSERPGAPRADALLAGFSNAVIARAVKSGAIVQRDVAPNASRRRRALAEAPFPATGEQASALERIAGWLAGKRFAQGLIHGVTGSGKTYVYVEAIKSVVREGGRAIVLVPEISLTPQTARRFEDAFGERVAVLHSALSERERFDAWQACMRGEIDVVVGARSAVFAPLADVRLLVVDESHETSYKQETVPRYNAVTVARERMRAARGVLLLGSATPSLESYEAATRGALAHIELRARATAASMPAVTIVDLKKEFEAGNRGIFSTALVTGIEERLERREKIVLFVNRRGSAGFLLCRNCGFVPECPRCSVSLSAHRGEGLLRCHYCDHQEALPALCGTCGMQTIREFGVGTERVAEEVTKLFAEAHVLRMDSDTTTRIGDHARILGEFGDAGDVLVGTQMVAKGLDFPTVTLVGVVAADVGLHIPDFRAAERAFSLTAQVCGRSGRTRPGEAIVQTYSPEHPAIVFAATHDYAGFAALELEERRVMQFPPFARLVYIGVIGRNRAAVLAASERYANLLRLPEIEVLGPAAYPIARVNNEWRYRVALKTRKPQVLRSAIRERILPLARSDRTTRLAVNVDP
ncbi:MAG TPA: primosomal protein N' [Candidatus Baltobacteraceae bacterium]|nr:primosomal protein N' [Candidatus Baltobacteraceae bacterium]